MALSLALITGGRTHILPKLANDPTWQRTRLKSAEGAASILVQIAKSVAIEEARALIIPEIEVWYKELVAKNGPRPSGAQWSEWDEAHDDGLMALFEPFSKVLSASWLNFTSTDARIWQAGETERLANSFAQEIWKQLTWQRSDNQILAGIGIVADDLADFGQIEISEPEPEPKADPMAVNAVLNKIMLSFPDPKTLQDDLDLASDQDQTLALGAAQRLGINPTETAALRLARGGMNGTGSNSVIQAWAKVIEAGEMLDTEKVFVDLEPAPAQHPTNALPPPPPPPVGTIREALTTSVAITPPPPPPPPPVTTLGPGPAPTNTGKGGRRTKLSDTPPPGHIPVDVIRSIKEHAGLKDEIMAELFGLSRPTLANIMKGKGHFVPADDRREAIRSTVQKHISELSNALTKL
jgi:hypothetical protein